MTCCASSMRRRAGLPGRTQEERTEIAGGLFDLTPAKAERSWRRSGRRGAAGLDARRRSRRTGGAGRPHERALAERGLPRIRRPASSSPPLLRARPDLAASCRARFRWISVDDYQDVDPLQYALIRILAPADGNLCAIGDPDQSIYGFRGADAGFFLRFREDWPGARVVHLSRNYRSTHTLVEAACQAIRPGSLVPERRLVAVREGTAERIVVQRSASERAEAELVVHTLERLFGGTSSFSFDSGRVGAGEGEATGCRSATWRSSTDGGTGGAVDRGAGPGGRAVPEAFHRPLTGQPGSSRPAPDPAEEALASGRW